MVYMKNLLGKALPVIKGFVFCGVLLQIVLGFIYIGSNITSVPAYWETTIYTEIAQKFILDEYMTGIYPFLIKLFSWITFVPYQIPIYLLQIALGIFSVYKIAEGWTGDVKTSIVIALWVNTLPFVAQAHVTVLPHAFVWTIMAVMVSIVAKATYEKRTLPLRDWIYLLTGFTLIAQLDNSYFIVACLLLLWGCFLQWYQACKKVLAVSLATLACVVIILGNIGIHIGTQTPGYYGRMQRSVEAAVFQRFGTSVLLEELIYYMPEEVKTSFGGKELEAFQKYPYQLQRNFGPTLEARYGKERANEIYLELGQLGLQNATKNTASAIAKDTLNYAFPMGMYHTWQEDHAMGATSWNIQQFLRNAPKISTFYMCVAQIGWWIGLLAGAVCGILAFGSKHRNGLRLSICLVMYVILYSMFFALRGTGIYDYKLALLPLIIACIPACYSGIYCLRKL